MPALTVDNPVDNLFFEVDNLVEQLEEKGYELTDIIDVMAKYIEVAEECL